METSVPSIGATSAIPAAAISASAHVTHAAPGTSPQPRCDLRSSWYLSPSPDVGADDHRGTPASAPPKNHGQRHRRPGEKLPPPPPRAAKPSRKPRASHPGLSRTARDARGAVAPPLACVLAYAHRHRPAAGAAAAVCVSHALAPGVTLLAAAVTAFLRRRGVRVGAVCTAAAARLGRRRAAVGDDGHIIADDVGTVAGAPRPAQKPAEADAQAHGEGGHPRAGDVGARRRLAPALAVAAAVAAAVVGAVAAALTLAREPSPRTARTAALRRFSRRRREREGALKHHGACGAVAGVALGSGLHRAPQRGGRPLLPSTPSPPNPRRRRRRPTPAHLARASAAAAGTSALTPTRRRRAL